MAEDKGFRPSKKKLDNARRDGRVLKSPLITEICAFLATCIALPFAFGDVWVACGMLLECFGTAAHPSELLGVLQFAGTTVLWAAVLTVGSTVCGGIAAEGFQVGFRVESQTLAPKSERLNPASGVKRVGSGIKESWFVVLRCVVMSGVMLWFLGVLLVLTGRAMALTTGVSELSTRAVVFSFSAVTLVLIFAFVDYLLKRRVFYRELSMSLDEIRREHKEDEGDPHMKAARRSMHQTMALQDLSRRVRQSRVVVVKRPERRA